MKSNMPPALKVVAQLKHFDGTSCVVAIGMMTATPQRLHVRRTAVMDWAGMVGLSWFILFPIISVLRLAIAPGNARPIKPMYPTTSRLVGFCVSVFLCVVFQSTASQAVRFCQMLQKRLFRQKFPLMD